MPQLIVDIAPLIDQVRALTPEQVELLALAPDLEGDVVAALVIPVPGTPRFDSFDAQGILLAMELVDAVKDAEMRRRAAPKLFRAYLGLVRRDLLLDPEHAAVGAILYSALTQAWREIVGPVHAGDGD